MKRFPLTTSPSRQQRGFFRVTALVLSAGLIGAGVITTQQVNAHQANQHSQTKKTTVKPPVKDCGCGVLVSKSHAAKLSQIGTTTMTDNYDHAVALKAGQRLALGVSDPAGAVQPGGAWDASFGTVDAAGVYTAPNFTPPEGLDRIHYLDPKGDDIYVNVRILPNLSIPNSGQTPYVTVAYATGGAIQAPPNQSQAQIGDLPIPDQVFAPTSQTVVVLPGETPAPPQQINTTAPLAAETVNNTSVLTLPATDGGGNASPAVYAQPLDEIPQSVTLLPNSPRPIVRCDSGDLAVWDPYTVTPTPHKGMETLADIKADSGVTATVFKTFGLNLTLGLTYHVKGQFYDWKRSRIKYVYKCINNRWVLQYTRHCDSYTLSLVTAPPWAIIFEGYPRNNQPLLPYSPEGCHA